MFRSWICGLSALASSVRKTLVDFLEILLQPLLNVGFYRSKLNSHSYSGIAGSDYTVAAEFFRINPERDDDFRTNRQRQESFHVASASTDVCRIALHVRPPLIREADLKRKEDFVPGKHSLLSPRLRSKSCRTIFCRNLSPRGLLVHKNFDPCLDPVGDSRFLDPNDVKARLLVPVLNSDDLASFQGMVDP